MKKYLFVVLTFCLLLPLAACGGGQEQEAPFDPAADAQTLLASGAFSEELTEIDQAIACALYGIDEAAVTASAVYGSTGATAEELALFTLKDEQAAQAALTRLQYRVEDRTEEMAGYLPNEIPKLEDAVVTARGCSVLLAVAGDYGPVTSFLGG